jgi:pimeloyl-ACP methyl ester carboxylesterase
VVFVHGAGGDHTVWGRQIASLRGRAGILAMDLPGHGRSGRAAEHTIPRLAAILLETISGAGLHRPVVVGHSMGGAVVLQAALDAHAALSGVVLVGSGARLAVAPGILELLAREPAAALRMLARTAYAEGAPADMIRQGEEALAHCGADILLADFRACNEFDVRDRVAKLQLPLLAICGSEDRLTFPKFSEWLVKQVPGACLHIVKGAGHLVMIERPEEVSAAILRFLGRGSVTGDPTADPATL